ncbi:hypothetical protein CIPAW_02G086500 [Carya illinoinensis]|uniref:Uncharacterized protein n=1 Tax=Carya illinoinensis TaxID=32201 RepID=A0A8T1RA47_CARIL|nr:hypothetical protein CIPAW_02G086500 [Carya illinoinensis]
MYHQQRYTATTAGRLGRVQTAMRTRTRTITIRMGVRSNPPSSDSMQHLAIFTHTTHSLLSSSVFFFWFLASEGEEEDILDSECVHHVSHGNLLQLTWAVEHLFF